MMLVQNMVKSGPRVHMSSSQWRRFVVEGTEMLVGMLNFSTC